MISETTFAQLKVSADVWNVSQLIECALSQVKYFHKRPNRRLDTLLNALIQYDEELFMRHKSIEYGFTKNKLAFIQRERRLRAVAALSPASVQRNSLTGWAVASSRAPSAFYVVHFRLCAHGCRCVAAAHEPSGRAPLPVAEACWMHFECNCADYARRHLPCKHTLQVLMSLGHKDARAAAEGLPPAQASAPSNVGVRALAVASPPRAGNVPALPLAHLHALAAADEADGKHELASMDDADVKAAPPPLPLPQPSTVERCFMQMQRIQHELRTPMGTLRAGRVLVQLEGIIGHLTGAVPRVVEQTLQPIEKKQHIAPNSHQQTLHKLQRRKPRKRAANSMGVTAEQLDRLRADLLRSIAAPSNQVARPLNEVTFTQVPVAASSPLALI